MPRDAWEICCGYDNEPITEDAEPLTNALLGYDIQAKLEAPKMQTFPSGATRSANDDKIDYEGILSFPVLEMYGQYMMKHRLQADGTMRSSDNWKAGFPMTGESAVIKSISRHVFELAMLHNGHVPSRVAREMPNATHRERLIDSACAVMFNVMAYMHELLRDKEFGTGKTV